jgi:autotransporter-associated beta strand protein
MKNTVSILRSRAACLLPALFVVLSAAPTYAGSATWLLDPVDNNWSNPNNWMPNTVPNSTVDVANFDVSNTTAISIVEPIELGSLIFNPDASPYTITASATTLSIFGAPGVVNNSGVVQEIVAGTPGQSVGGTIQFVGDASAGTLVHFDVSSNADIFPESSMLHFYDNSNAGSASFDIEGASEGTPEPGNIFFYDSSSAASATFTLHPGVITGNGAGLTFAGSSSADTATITCEAKTVDASSPCSIFFSESSTAASATIIVNGSDNQIDSANSVDFTGDATAGAATLIANGGSRQGGAIIFGNIVPLSATARVILNGNGVLDTGPNTSGIVTIGSLEGDRQSIVLLARTAPLAIGSNNLSTTYAGTIQDKFDFAPGALTKIGNSSLTLTGTNRYTGSTTVSHGNLIVGNRNGSGTGTGPVQVDAGTIGGSGTIAGALTVGDGGGGSATLQPAVGTKKQVTLTVEGALTLNADSAYSYTVNTGNGEADGVVASGVTINTRARFVLRSRGSASLTPGTIFVAINNTAATPIAGNFNGLAEGSTITAGNNTYEVSYEGGDGNDFTLTVL